MNIDDFAEILKIGESINTEFKSWNKVSDMKKRINLAVDELIAFANNKGGTLYFGVEDNEKLRVVTVTTICRTLLNQFTKKQDRLFLLIPKK